MTMSTKDAVLAAEEAIVEFAEDIERTKKRLTALDAAQAALDNTQKEVRALNERVGSCLRAVDNATKLLNKSAVTTARDQKEQLEQTTALVDERLRGIEAAFEARLRVLQADVSAAAHASATDAGRTLADSALVVREAESSFAAGAELLKSYADAYRTSWIRAASKALDAVRSNALEASERILSTAREVDNHLATTSAEIDERAKAVVEIITTTELASKRVADIVTNLKASDTGNRKWANALVIPLRRSQRILIAISVVNGLITLVVLLRMFR